MVWYDRGAGLSNMASGILFIGFCFCFCFYYCFCFCAFGFFFFFLFFFGSFSFVICGIFTRNSHWCFQVQEHQRSNKRSKNQEEQQCGNHGRLFCIIFGFIPLALEDNSMAFLCVELSGNAKNCLHPSMKYNNICTYIDIKIKTKL